MEAFEDLRWIIVYFRNLGRAAYRTSPERAHFDRVTTPQKKTKKAAPVAQTGEAGNTGATASDATKGATDASPAAPGNPPPAGPDTPAGESAK